MKPDLRESGGRRGRPVRTAMQTEETRAKIAAVAEGLFRREGYASVSMRRIAQESGYTTATLYNYFKAKTEILQRLWGGIFDDLFRALSANAPWQANSAEYLAYFGAFYATYWIENPERYRLVFMSEGVGKPEVDAFLADEAIASRFAELGRAVVAALPPNVDPALVKMKVDLFICVLHGIAHNRIMISGYPWSSPAELVGEATRGLLS